MTSVNVTTTKNTVTVNGETRVVTVKTQGPQGPSLPDGDKGDVTVSSNGTAISINNSAVTSAKIADGAIVDADINASAAIALTKLATGALPTAITVTSANISDLSIVDADISASAAISLSKLATGALPTAITVTSANISDLSIVNADINASAAIAGTKISPDFGSQNIVTTGTAATGALGVTGNLTVSGTVDGVDVATRDALFGGLTSSSGVLSNGVTATTQSASDNSTKIATTAYTDTAISNLINGAPAALDTLNELAAALNDDAAFSTTVTNSIATKMPLAGGQFTGNVTFSGTQTVDGRDLSVDGAKLDGIESGATADQTKSDIDALGIAASTATTLATARTIAGVSFDGSADISLNNNAITNGAGYITATLTNEQVQDIVGGMLTGNTETGITVTYQDGDGTIDFAVNQDTTGNAATATALETARTIAGTSFDGSANIDISYTNLTNKLSVGDGGLTQNNFTDALKTKLDGVETGATADQTASEIKTAYESNSDTNAFTDADHTKLDGIEASATADQTASEILTLIKTVDGSGSGLDADLLDGVSSASFLRSDADDTLTASLTCRQITPQSDSTFDIGTSSTRFTNIYGDNIHGDGSNLTSLPAGQLTGTVAAARLDTATTQSAGNNSTKIATTAYTDTAVANLVDSAPGTLNTLNELAAALGDDPNFATTVTNSIATKLPLAGGQITGNITCSGSQTFDGRDLSVDGTKLDGIESNATADQTASEIVALVADQTIAPSEIDMEDNEKILLGTGDDLQIYHDGSYSFIDDNGTGNLQIRTNGTKVTLQGGTNAMLNAIKDGAVELYYDNSKKFETTSSGATITGTLIADGLTLYDNEKLLIGSNTDIEVFHDGTNSIFQSDTGDLQINSGNSAGNVEINVNNNVAGNTRETSAKFIKNGAVELYYDNSKKLHTVADGIYVTGNIYSNKTGTAAAISLTDNGRLAFGSGADLQIYHDGGHSYIHQDGTGSLYILADTFRLNNEANTENIIAGNANGAAELYYDNSKTFATKAGGNTLYGTDASGNVSLGRFYFKQESGTVRALYDPNAQKFQHYDNTYATFGNGDDLQIYHDGSHSYITNTTGDLKITDTSAMILSTNSLRLRNGAGDETYIAADANSDVALYYDNSKKFETTSAGATLTGALTTTGNINVPTANSVVTGSVVTTNATALTAVDNGTAYFGTGLDLRISHTGTNSYITNTTGTLFTLSNIFEVKGSDGNETHLKTTNDGAVELYYDNSVKLATTGAGVDINGNLNFDDNEYALFGNSNDLQIYHDGSNSYIQDTDQGNLFIEASAVLIRKNGTTENIAKFIQDGAVELYYDNSKRIETLAEGAKVKRHDGGATTLYIEGAEGANAILDMYADDGDDLADKFRLTATTGGTFYMQNYANNGWQSNIAYTGAGNVELYYDGSKKLETTSTGVSVTGNITATGSVSVPDSQELICGDSSDLRIFHDGTNNIIRSGSTPTWIQTDDTINLTKNNASEYLAKFIGDGGVELYYDNSRKFRTYSSGVKIASDSSSGRLVFEDTDGNFCWQLTGFDAVSSGSGGRGAFQDANGAIVLDMRASGGNIFSYNTIKLNGGGSVDNLKLILGASDDLQIYHDGSHSYIDNNTGSLRVRDAGGAEKFRVSGTGTQFNDDITLSNDNDKINIGAGNDLQIYHDGSGSSIDNATGQLAIACDDAINLQSKTGAEYYFRGFLNNRVELYYDGSKKLETTSSGINVTGSLGIGTTSPDTPVHIFANDAQLLTVQRDGNNNANIRFRNQTSSMFCGLTSGATGFAIDDDDNLLSDPMFFVSRSSGNVGIGTASPSAKLDVNGDATINDIRVGKGANSVAGNTVLGESALDAAVSGGNNTAIGNSALSANTSGLSNTAVGKNTLVLNTTGAENVAVGSFSLDDNTSGSNNVAIGNSVLGNNTTASNNTGIGKDALHANTTGTANTAIGKGALDANTTGSYHIAIGNEALGANTTGDSNLAIGYSTLEKNTTGTRNVGVGTNALEDNVTGNYNVAVGYDVLREATASNNTAVGDAALTANTTGASNTAVGRSALAANTTGANNTALGALALDANTTASNSVAIGYLALTANTTGTQNIAIGVETMDANTTGSFNVAVGKAALGANTTADYNVAIGQNCLAANTTGTFNTAVGAFTLDANTTADYNTACGYAALTKNTTGSNNTGVGKSALYENTTGANNVAIGSNALDANTTASNNTAVGTDALTVNTTGQNNTAVGIEALDANTTASNNTAIGSAALGVNTTGANNVAVGSLALDANTTGHSNVGVGKDAGSSVTTGIQNTLIGTDAGAEITAGYYNTCVGNNSGQDITNGYHNVAIGHSTDTNNVDRSITIGTDLTSKGSDYITFGRDSVGVVYNQYNQNASWTRDSDERLKKDINTNTDCGLEFINDLRTVTYKWKAPSEIDSSMPNYDKDNSTPSYDKKMYGFIAQEVKAALDKHNITDFGGWTCPDDGIQGISYEMFVMPLVKAVQELSAKVKALEAG